MSLPFHFGIFKVKAGGGGAGTRMLEDNGWDVDIIDEFLHVSCGSSHTQKVLCTMGNEIARAGDYQSSQICNPIVQWI